MPRKSKTSFADKAKSYIRKASMREGDPISEKSLMANLAVLRDRQEEVREAKGLLDDVDNVEGVEEMAYGGMMYDYGGLLYQNGGTIPTFSGVQVPDNNIFRPGFNPPTLTPTLNTNFPLDVQGNPLALIGTQPFGYNPFGEGLPDSTTITPTSPQTTTIADVDGIPTTTRRPTTTTSRRGATGSPRTRPQERGFSLPTRTGDVFEEGTLQIPTDRGTGTTTPTTTTGNRRNRGFFTPGESGLRPSDYTQAGILAASTVGNLLLNERPEDIDATQFYAPFINRGPDLSVDEAPIRRTFAGARRNLASNVGSGQGLLSGLTTLASAEAEAVGDQATNVSNVNIQRQEAIDRINAQIAAQNAATRARVSELEDANQAVYEDTNRAILNNATTNVLQGIQHGQNVHDVNNLFPNFDVAGNVRTTEYGGYKTRRKKK